jgi:hypothetical protein
LIRKSLSQRGRLVNDAKALFKPWKLPYRSGEVEALKWNNTTGYFHFKVSTLRSVVIVGVNPMKGLYTRFWGRTGGLVGHQTSAMELCVSGTLLPWIRGMYTPNEV